MDTICDGNQVREKPISEINDKIMALYEELQRTPLGSDKWSALYSAKQALSWAVCDLKCPLQMTLDWTNEDGSFRKEESARPEMGQATARSDDLLMLPETSVTAAGASATELDRAMRFAEGDAGR